MKIIKNLTLLVICICLFLDISMLLCNKQAKVKNSSQINKKNPKVEAIQRVKNSINRNKLSNKFNKNKDLKKNNSNKCRNKVFCVTKSDILEYKNRYNPNSKTDKQIIDSIISCRLSFINYVNDQKNRNINKSNIVKNPLKNHDKSCILNKSIISCISSNNKNKSNSFINKSFSNNQNLNKNNDYDIEYLLNQI